MLRTTWRRLGSPTRLAIGLIVLLPALAEAQLFPNMHIKREKPAPPLEAPYHSQVRRDYFGYYPTCWRKFPEGWQCPCPNPELPNPAASFRDMPRDKDRVPAGADSALGPDGTNPDGMDPAKPANPDNDPANVPLPNPGRSPFELDTNPKAPTTPPATPDPFLTPDPAAPKPPTGGNPSVPPANRPAPPASLMEMPKLPSTTPAASLDADKEPGSMVMVPEATLASNSDTTRPDLGPLPSAPLPATSVPLISANYSDAQPVLGVPAPAQAPRRRGILGNLFGRGNTRTR